MPLPLLRTVVVAPVQGSLPCTNSSKLLSSEQSSHRGSLRVQAVLKGPKCPPISPGVTKLDFHPCSQSQLRLTAYQDQGYLATTKNSLNFLPVKHCSNILLNNKFLFILILEYIYMCVCIFLF